MATRRSLARTTCRCPPEPSSFHHRRASRRKQGGLPRRVGGSGGRGRTTHRQREIAGSRRAQATMGGNACGDGVVLGGGRRRHRSRDSELSAKRPPKFKIGGWRHHRGRKRRRGGVKLPLRRGNEIRGDVRALDVGRRRHRRSRDVDLRVKEASKIQNTANTGRLRQQVEEVLIYAAPRSWDATEEARRRRCHCHRGGDRSWYLEVALQALAREVSSIVVRQTSSRFSG